MPTDEPRPPAFTARNYTQRPKDAFSQEARELLFDFTARTTTCELGEGRQPAAKVQRHPKQTL